MEKSLITAAITSNAFWEKFGHTFDASLLESESAQILARWCHEYYQKYEKAPGAEIQLIYSNKVAQGINKETAELIESALDALSGEYDATNFDSAYVIEQVTEYLKAQQIKRTIEDASYELQKGEQQKAEATIIGYLPLFTDSSTFVDPFSTEVCGKVKAAFQQRSIPLVEYGKALGALWNAELVRGGFVAVMGAEKSGKTMLCLDVSMRAMKNERNVAFFQAGDMTEQQQLRRMAIYLTGRSDEERYCQKLWMPRVDCLAHQLDLCDRAEREDAERIFKDKKEINYKSLLLAAETYVEHRCCHNCKNLVGTPCLVSREPVNILTWTHAYKALREFGKKRIGQFRLSTHPNESLSISQMKSILKMWERQNGFRPDVIIVDYPDILDPDSDTKRFDFRHQQNKIWQRLRRLSEDLNCLVFVVTQIAARGYSKKLLSLDDFSEDKRKFAHVTAMYGINQTPDEKRIGLFRMNEIVIREADFDTESPVYVLQRLQAGKPVMESWR